MVAKRYDESVANTRYAVPQWIDEHLPDEALARMTTLLDLGCANGIQAQRLRQRWPAIRAVGVDSSLRMIEAVRERGVYEELHLHDLNKPTPFLGVGSFDLIIATGFLEFLERIDICLAEIRRLLHAEGTAIISIQQHLPGDANALRATHSGDALHCAYTIDEVEQMIGQAGLVVDKLGAITGYTTGNGYSCPYIMALCKKS